MNKSKQLIARVVAQPLTGTGEFSETFRNIPASVAGPSGKLHRHVAALLLTCVAVFSYVGQSTPPDLNGDETMDLLFGRILWTYYGGEIVSSLTASELTALVAAQGCIAIDKDALVYHASGWSGDPVPVQTVYASILIPVTPTMFSTGHTVGATDAPLLASLFGASSQFTCSYFQKPPTDVEVVASTEATALCWDTPDAMVPRPIRYRKYATHEDPATIPTQYSKIPTMIAGGGKRGTAITPFLSSTAIVRVLADDRAMEERMPTRVKQYADAWYRDDADRLFITNADLFMILRSPFEAEKMINQPAASLWTVEGLGAAQGETVRYLYVEFDEASNDLVAFAVSSAGLPPGANSVDNVTINSNARNEMKLTAEETLGVPHRMAGSRFKA